jgi:pimeloyl-ACP methyl ester carboxylesterase
VATGRVTDEPLVIPSRDGTPVAAFRSGRSDGPPLVLVHGASADHTTFRVLAPALADTFDLYALDRRGRGASGDTLPYAIEREYEDVAAVAVAVAEGRGVRAVDAFGHSYGGRCVLGAAILTDRLRRVVSYEGAPAAPGTRYGDAALAAELTGLAEVGRPDELLETFLRRVVGMGDAEIAAYRADPVWPLRVAAAPTIARELRVESGSAAALDHLGTVRQPVLQVLGGASLPTFATATQALDDRLVDGTVVTIPGARHAAHHSHVPELVATLRTWLGAEGR